MTTLTIVALTLLIGLFIHDLIAMIMRNKRINDTMNYNASLLNKPMRRGVKRDNKGRFMKARA